MALDSFPLQNQISHLTPTTTPTTMNVSTQQRRIAKGKTVTPRNRVREICSPGSVGGAGEATPRLYPDIS